MDRKKFPFKKCLNVRQGADTHQFLSALVSLLNLYKDTLLVGDFNLPLLSSFSHPVIVQISKLGFNQLVSSATHDKGFEHFKTSKFFIWNILLIFRRNSRLGLSEIKWTWSGKWGYPYSPSLCYFFGPRSHTNGNSKDNGRIMKSSKAEFIHRQ